VKKKLKPPEKELLAISLEAVNEIVEKSNAERKRKEEKLRLAIAYTSFFNGGVDGNCTKRVFEKSCY
jgi:hypothetical protein